MYTEPSLAQLRNYRWHTEVVCELDVLTDAWNLARRSALGRLREEAIQVGADAVVGVHLRHSDHDIGKGTIECVVSGTAVRLPRSPRAASPALNALSVQDYWRLHESGHEPVGLLATTVAVFASPARATRVRRARTISQNQELNELSRGFQAARETVRTKLRGQISDLGGTGAVGVGFSHSVARGQVRPGLLAAGGRSARLAHGPLRTAVSDHGSGRGRSPRLGDHDARRRDRDSRRRERGRRTRSRPRSGWERG